MKKPEVNLLVESLLNETAIPARFVDVRELRKPSELPDNSKELILSAEETAYLDSLPAFEVDGQDLDSVDFPPGVHRLVMVDFTTKIPWLVDTAGYNYPRYVMNINGYTSSREIAELDSY